MCSNTLYSKLTYTHDSQSDPLIKQTWLPQMSLAYLRDDGVGLFKSLQAKQTKKTVKFMTLKKKQKLIFFYPSVLPRASVQPRSVAARFPAIR